MYRATAEAVSGIFVCAGGKWLRCIGNKRVAVGEHIWTDGRCVYGHLQESEQPKVITAPPENEGIPILTADGTFYTFQKNKLKRVAKIKSESGKINLYKDVAGELEFVNEMPDTDKWTVFSLMINDYRKTAFLYDEGTHYKSGYYGTKSFVSDTQLIASNIDKLGNRFDMVIRYEIKEHGSEINIQSGEHVVTKSVEILRNGEVVKTIHLQPIADDVVAACPDTDPLWQIIKGGVLPEYEETMSIIAPNGFNAFASSTRSNLGLVLGDNYPRAFIEDEQTWCFWFTAICEKETYFNEDFWGTHLSTDTVWRKIPGLAGAVRYRHYLVTEKGKSVVWEERIEKYYPSGAALDAPYQSEYSLSKAERITIPLQDGYRCEAYDFFGWNDIYGFSYSDPPVITETVFAFMTFYTPKNEDLFTGVFPLWARCLICKISSGHLFYVSDSMKEIFGADFDSYKGAPVISRGFHILKNGKCSPINPQTYGTINQRLRPMKKIRGWQNRIKLIELNQHEI